MRFVGCPAEAKGCVCVRLKKMPYLWGVRFSGPKFRLPSGAMLIWTCAQLKPGAVIKKGDVSQLCGGDRADQDAPQGQPLPLGLPDRDRAAGPGHLQAAGFLRR